MSLQFRWMSAPPALAAPEVELIAETRMRCFAAASKDLGRFRDDLSRELRAGVTEYLLAERDGRPVGTTTSWALDTWMRSARLRCLGVAYVGTVRTERRQSHRGPSAGGGGAGRGGGIATQLMCETLRRARERGFPLTALMPFRPSFYEHFGYGVVEQRCEWNIPLSILPHGDTAGIRYFEPADLPALAALRQAIVARGQCDFERLPITWEQFIDTAQNGFFIVDRAAPDGPARGWMIFSQVHERGRDLVQVLDWGADQPADFRRLLHFLSGLRDQASAVVIHLPSDLPLQRLLREPQIPHRPVNHATAALRPYTRMQLRVLDHAAVLSALRLPPDARGSAVVAIHETERDVSRFKIDIDAGRAHVGFSAATPDIQTTDRTWAAIVTGDLPARQAAMLGLLESATDPALSALECFAAGPRPCTFEYF